MIEITFAGETRDEVLAKIREFSLLEVPSLADRISRSKPKVIAKGKPASTVPEPAIAEQEPEPQPEPQPEEAVTPEAEKAIALIKLKSETLDRLRDLFNAGKGTFVRELLAKYGEGAKVFPEVDAKHFPQIKADIDRELN